MTVVAADETTDTRKTGDEEGVDEGAKAPWFDTVLAQASENGFFSSKKLETRSAKSVTFLPASDESVVDAILTDLDNSRADVSERMTIAAFGKNVNPFELNDKEWSALNATLGKLCCYAAWQVARSNGVSKEEEIVSDMIQNCMEALIRSAMYFKRMFFVNKAIDYISNNVSKVPPVLIPLINYDIVHRWGSRRVLSGARGFKNREIELALVLKCMRHDDSDVVVDPRAPLEITNHFKAYAKTIIWNTAKNDGVQIAKDKRESANHVSIDACGWLAIDTTDSLNELVSCDQLRAIGDELKRLPDQRPFQVFDTLTCDPEAFDPNTGNIVRKTVKERRHVGYATIRKCMEPIREAIEFTGGVERVLIKSGIAGRGLPKDALFSGSAQQEDY